MSADESQFRDFVLHRWPQLVRYAYLLTGDAMQAEDLVQVALERSWRHWGRIRSDNPEAYVRTAIARGAISRFRARSRRVAEAPLEGVSADVRSAAPDGAQARAERDLVWRQLAGLPPRMRAVVVLRLWEDLTVEETARVLGCSTGTVKSTLSRATERLRASADLRELAGVRSTDDTEVTR